MKVIKVLLLMFLVQSCVAQKSTNVALGEVSYSAKSRGSSKNITVVSGNVYYKTQNSSKTFFITLAQKEALKESIAKLAIEEIGDLKAPSNKRAFDGAMHARISIHLNDTTYVSSDFDDGNPPEELKPLVELLESFVH